MDLNAYNQAFILKIGKGKVEGRDFIYRPSIVIIK